jgi:hypothetical protein
MLLDICILYVLLDLKDMAIVFTSYLLKIQDILSKDNKHKKVLKKTNPIMFNIFINGKFINIFSYLIEKYNLIRKYLYLIFYESIFVILPKLYKKFLYYTRRDVI